MTAQTKEESVSREMWASILSIGFGKGRGIFLALVTVTVVISGCGEPADVRAERSGIISLGPNITETVFALGQGHRLIGVTRYCDYPPEVERLEKVGGYVDPDIEKITMLVPELIIAQGNPQGIAFVASHNSARVVQVYMDSIATIDEAIATIGEALGCEKRAEVLRAEIKVELETVRRAVEDLPRAKVLIITGRMDHDLNSLSTASGASFLSELVDMAGGENIYKDANQPYPEASKETVVLESPDVILEFHAGERLSADEQARYIADWQRLPSLPAVKNGRVHLIMESHAMRPGPRVGEIARRFASLLHPNADLSRL